MASPNMINHSPQHRGDIPNKKGSPNPQGTNSSGSTNCGNTNTGGSSSRGTMFTPGGSFRSNTSKYVYNGNGNNSPDNKKENEFYNSKVLNKNECSQTNGKPTKGMYCDSNSMNNTNHSYFEEDTDDQYYNQKYCNYTANKKTNAEKIHRYFHEDRYSNGTAMFKDKYKHPAVNAVIQQESSQILKYRDRSYSDIQQMDKRQWHMRQEEVNPPRRGSYIVHQPTRV